MTNAIPVLRDAKTVRDVMTCHYALLVALDIQARCELTRCVIMVTNSTGWAKFSGTTYHFYPRDAS